VTHFSGRESTCSVRPFRVDVFSPEEASRSGIRNVLFRKKIRIGTTLPHPKKEDYVSDSYTIVGTLMVVLFNAITGC